MEVSAHDLTETILCKQPGCTNEELTRMGPYAMLCATHKHARREAQAAPPPLLPRLTSVPDSCAEQARELVRLGKAVDKARAGLTQKRAGLRPAEQKLAAAERAWQDALGRLQRSDAAASNGA